MPRVPDKQKDVPPVAAPFNEDKLTSIVEGLNRDGFRSIFYGTVDQAPDYAAILIEPAFGNLMTHAIMDIEQFNVKITRSVDFGEYWYFEIKESGLFS